MATCAILCRVISEVESTFIKEGAWPHALAHPKGMTNVYDAWLHAPKPFSRREGASLALRSESMCD